MVIMLKLPMYIRMTSINGHMMFGHYRRWNAEYIDGRSLQKSIKWKRSLTRIIGTQCFKCSQILLQPEKITTSYIMAKKQMKYKPPCTTDGFITIATLTLGEKFPKDRFNKFTLKYLLENQLYITMTCYFFNTKRFYWYIQHKKEFLKHLKLKIWKYWKYVF